MRPHPVFLAATMICALSSESRPGKALDLQIQAVPPARTGSGGGAASVFVHVEADPGVWLEASHPKQDDWSLACLAPCDLPLPWGLEYRVGGPGSFDASGRFVLGSSPKQSLRVQVIPSSRGAAVGGGALMLVGSLGLALGITLIATGARASDARASDTVHSLGAIELLGGGAISALSLVGVIGGGVLLVHNLYARVHLEPLPRSRDDRRTRRPWLLGSRAKWMTLAFAKPSGHPFQGPPLSGSAWLVEKSRSSRFPSERPSCRRASR